MICTQDQTKMNQELDELPPPAYTDTELDQKVQQAIQLSEKTRQPEEEWEQWDESAFEAAASGKAARFSESYVSGSTSAPGSSAQSSSSRSLPHRPPAQMPLPEVAPLRIRPRAATNASSSSAPPVPTPSENEAHPYQQERRSDEDEDDDDSAPPPFTAVGPSLDGPPFEEVVRLSYNPSIDSPTPQPVVQSPLPEPTIQLPPHEGYPLQSGWQQQRLQAQPARHSYPAPEFPPQNNDGGPQRVPSYMTSHKHAPTMPRLNFNPSVAYGSGKRGSGGIMPQVQPLHPVDPLSFYKYTYFSIFVKSFLILLLSSSTVVAHMKPRAMQPIRSSQT